MSVIKALDSFPMRLRDSFALAYREKPDWVDAFMSRGTMSPARALMAGLALDPTTRDIVDRSIGRYCDTDAEMPVTADEVIVGGGAHAAIWAAVRRATGGAPPLVLEREDRFGGMFAMTTSPSFFLNSRNRPGPGGAPGSRDALNVIPGAPMQPSDMSGAEYQVNADLGLVVRCTLAMNAPVRTAKVESVLRNGDRIIVSTNRGNVSANRVIIATGLGRDATWGGARIDGERILTFKQFMQRFDNMSFPLQGLGRVAVVGGGDSGRTVVEALAGYGPATLGSVASMDYVSDINWYGVEATMTKERWLECNRTRYKRLAALFPDKAKSVSNARVVPRERLDSIARMFETVQINGQTYDTVVSCAGYKRESLLDPDERLSTFRAGLDNDRPDKGVILGNASEDRRIVVVGPAADIPYEGSQDVRQTEENKVALFRLAPRTAALAFRL